MGIQHALIGAVMVQIVASCFSSYRVMICDTGFESLPFHRAIADKVIEEMKEQSDEAMLSTLLLAAMLMSLISGLCCLSLSSVPAFAKLPNYIPANVSNGLFAGIGWILFSLGK